MSGRNPSTQLLFAARAAFRTSDRRRCGKATTIIAVTYEAAAPAEDVVLPCVASRGGNLAVTLYFNSPLGWIVRSSPTPLERRELTDKFALGRLQRKVLNSA